MLSPEAERVLRYLVEVEELAEEVLADKRQIVDLDTKRNRNREGLRALQKDLSLTGMTVCHFRRRDGLLWEHVYQDASP